jgi:hypothetical protein
MITDISYIMELFTMLQEQITSAARIKIRMIRGSNLSKIKSFISSPECPDRHCGPLSLLFSGCREFCMRLFFTSKVDLRLRRRVVKCYIWSTALYGAENWILRNVYQKYFDSFEMWWWTRKSKIIWMYRVQNAVLRRVKGEINILHTIKRKI